MSGVYSLIDLGVRNPYLGDYGYGDWPYGESIPRIDMLPGAGVLAINGVLYTLGLAS